MKAIRCWDDLERYGNLPSKAVAELVSLTGKGAKQKSNATFTASDITDRLLPAAIREAYAENRRLTADDLVRHARTMLPTPSITDGDYHGE